MSSSGAVDGRPCSPRCSNRRPASAQACASISRALPCIVAEQEDLLGRRARAAAEREALDVDRLAQTHHLVPLGEPVQSAGDAVVEDDHGGNDRLELDGPVEVGPRGVGDEHLDGPWVARRQDQRDDGVLRDHPVAGSRQLVLRGDDAQPAGRCHLGHLAGLDSEDRDLVAEALELLGDGQQVGLGPAGGGELLMAEHELHRGDASGLGARCQPRGPSRRVADVSESPQWLGRRLHFVGAAVGDTGLALRRPHARGLRDRLGRDRGAISTPAALSAASTSQSATRLRTGAPQGPRSCTRPRWMPRISSASARSRAGGCRNWVARRAARRAVEPAAAPPPQSGTHST